MAVLKQKIDGDWIIQGPPYGGASMCTYQVSPDALGFLHFEGVEKGSSVPWPLLMHLIHEKLVWTGGTGAGEATNPAIFNEDLFAALIRWGRDGSDDKLPSLVQHYGGTLSPLFTKKFVQWLAALDKDIPLSDFSRLPLWEFRSIASVATGSNLPTFHQTTLARREYRLLWRLGRLVGTATAAEGGPPWIDRLRKLLQIFHISIITTYARKHERILPPVFKWLHDDQEIVAYLPRQRVASGTKVRWRVGKGSWEGIRIEHTFDGTFAVDRKSSALEPNCLSVELLVETPSGTVKRKAEIDSDASLLFTIDGDYLDAGSAPLGEYLLLYSRSIVPNLPVGVRSVECDVPVGWWDWKALRLHVAKTCQFLGVQFGGDQMFNWEWTLEPISQPVDLVEGHSMYFGSFPRIKFRSCPSSGTIKICRSGSATSHQVAVSAGTDSVDLNTTSRINPLEYGCYTVIGLPKDPRGVAKQLFFLYLPPVGFSYIPSELHPQDAFDLEISTTRVDICASDSNCIVEKLAPGRWRIRSNDPFASAGCTFLLKPPLSETSFPVSVRLPANRAYIVGPSFGNNAKWLALPLHVKLRDVDWKSRLRVQFAQDLDGYNTVQWRFSSERFFQGGTPVGGWPNAFDIALSDWRDTFGAKAQGVVDAILPNGNVTVALLSHADNNAPSLVVPTTTDTIAITEELRRALVSRRFQRLSDALADVVPFITSGADSALPSFVFVEAIFATLILGDKETCHRLLNLPELSQGGSDLQALRFRAEMRNVSHDHYWFNAATNSLFMLPGSFYTEIAKAEFLYRFGRLPGSHPRVLEDCAEHLMVAENKAAGVEIDDVMMLKSISHLILGRPLIDLEKIVVEIGAPAIRGLVALDRYFRTPLKCWNEPEITIGNCPAWASVDALFLTAAATQANALSKSEMKSTRIDSARRLLDALPKTIHCFWTELLRARQFTLEGRQQDARNLYRDVFTKYDVVIDEMD